MSWFVIGENGRTGPFDDRTILKLIQDGRLVRGGRIGRDGEADVLIEQSPFAQFLAPTMPDGARAAAAPSKAKAKPATFGAGWLFVVIALGFGAYWLSARDDTPVSNGASAEEASRAERDEERGARAIAEQFVEQELKAPGSATFGGREVTKLASGRYRVSGWVDAQNSFGAKIRNRYTVTVEKTGEKNWKPAEGPLLSPW